MTHDMHPTLARCFAATNEHDITGMTADLTADAVVKDEGREHRGIPAIREWAGETIRKYAFTVAPTSTARENERIVVAVTVSGTFAGSPLALTYAFALEGQKIARLEIG